MNKQRNELYFPLFAFTVLVIVTLAGCNLPTRSLPAATNTPVVVPPTGTPVPSATAVPTETTAPTVTPTSLPPSLTSSVTPSPTTSATDMVVTHIEQYLLASNPDFSGTILVAQKGKILISKGYGLADRENEVPNTQQTKFGIGSITKSFTALAVMILKERGLLDVQDPICKYISDCPPTWKAITLDHLLIHTSGIYNFTDLDADELKVNICEEHSPEEILSYIRDLPLNFEPGSLYRYSNSGYLLLGMVIEKVSGDSYETFIQKNILQPLGMNETGYDRTSTIVKNRASGYTLDEVNLQIINAPCWDVSLKYAAGGLYSTVGDLYKWDQALYTDKLVSKETLSTIVTPRAAMGGGTYYGYGWFISQQSGHQLIWHAGGVNGFVTQLARYLDDQVTIIVLSNLDKLDPVGISDYLAQIIFAGK